MTYIIPFVILCVLVSTSLTEPCIRTREVDIGHQQQSVAFFFLYTGTCNESVEDVGAAVMPNARLCGRWQARQNV